MAERQQACERNEKSSWCGRSPRDDSTAIHHARWLSRRKSITGVRPTVRLASRSLFHSAGSGSSRLVALYLYAPATATLRWKSTLGCHAADPAYYCITAAAGRVTNGDRSPAGPAGLTCCRSAQSHHLDIVVVG